MGIRAYTFLAGHYARIPVFAVYNRLGDYSYGTYVYAFPIQQLMASLGVLTPVANIALPLPLLCAVLAFGRGPGDAFEIWQATAETGRQNMTL